MGANRSLEPTPGLGHSATGINNLEKLHAKKPGALEFRDRAARTELNRFRVSSQAVGA